MVIRNRLLSLIYRAIESGLAIFTLVITFQSPLKNSRPFAYFSTEVTVFACIVFLLAFIFNLIDLIRHGISGIAAYVYMPITLATIVYLLTNGISYWILFPLIHGEPWAEGMGLATVMTSAVLPLLALLGWLLFDEKGTVKWRHGFYYVVYPFFYCIYSELAHYIFQDDFFAYAFMRPDFYFFQPEILSGNGGNNGVIISTVLFLLAFEAVSFLLIFLSNLLAGKYRRAS